MFGIHTEQTVRTSAVQTVHRHEPPTTKTPTRDGWDATPGAREPHVKVSTTELYLRHVRGEQTVIRTVAAGETVGYKLTNRLCTSNLYNLLTGNNR